MRARSWDIFCKVIDHYGDIGVCWRLARQLAYEHNRQVRLWVDTLDVFAKLNSDLDAALETQHCNGIEVRHWREPLPPVTPHDVVIEAFACELPEAFLTAMVARQSPTVRINLEYLSAESWIEDAHRRPSIHPRLPLTEHFYFPGFTAATGGLQREAGLLQARTDFQVNAAAIAAFWHTLSLDMPAPNELRVSLFCYPRAPLTALLEAWAQGDQPVTCIVAEDVTVPVTSHGSLRLQTIPFLSQPEYDRLLWACDLNFVRGEDSFTRAQWAGRPLVWQIYFQQEGAHWKKLEAFLNLYCAGLPAPAAADLRAFWRSWNGVDIPVGAWQGFWRHQQIFQAHAGHWDKHLARLPELTAGLVEFAEEQLQYAPF